MRLFSSALPVVLCLAVASPLIPYPGGAGVGAAKSISPIVGTWEAKEGQLRNGNAGTTMIFSDAGTVTIVIGAMIDGKYQFEGNQLKVDAPGSGLPPFQTVRFVADTAKIAASKFTRTLIPLTAPAEPHSLVGQWRSTDGAGVTFYEEYTASGSVRVRVPIEVWKGFYTVKDNLMTMRLLYPRMDERTASLTLTPRTLALRGRDGKADLFMRAEPLVPTDVEQPAQPR